MENSNYDSTKKRMEDAAERVKSEAKETANEFKEGWNQTTTNNNNHKLLAGLLGIFLGYLGIHKFVLGYNKEGIILLVLGLLGIVTCGITTSISGLIGLIEGIIYLTKSDEEFYNTYQLGHKPWF